MKCVDEAGNKVAIGEPGLALHQLLAIGLGLAFVVAVQRLRAESLPWLGRFIYVLAVGMRDAGHGTRATILAVIFCLISATFVWRSFYMMRITAD